MAIDSRSDDPQLTHELRKFGGREGLRAVGKGVIRVVMDFYQEAISAGSDGRASDRRNLVAAAGAMGRIGHDGKVRKFLDDRNRGDVQRVAKIGFKGANAALAEHHVVISTRKNIFRAEEKLLEGGRHAP